MIAASLRGPPLPARIDRVISAWSALGVWYRSGVLDVGVDVSPDQFRQRGPLHPGVLGSELGVGDLAVLQAEDVGRSRRSDLVQSVLTVDDEGGVGAERC